MTNIHMYSEDTVSGLGSLPTTIENLTELSSERYFITLNKKTYKENMEKYTFCCMGGNLGARYCGLRSVHLPW